MGKCIDLRHHEPCKFIIKNIMLLIHRYSGGTNILSMVNGRAKKLMSRSGYASGFSRGFDLLLALILVN